MMRYVCRVCSSPWHRNIAASSDWSVPLAKAVAAGCTHWLVEYVLANRAVQVPADRRRIKKQPIVRNFCHCAVLRACSASPKVVTIASRGLSDLPGHAAGKGELDR